MLFQGAEKSNVNNLSATPPVVVNRWTNPKDQRGFLKSPIPTRRNTNATCSLSYSKPTKESKSNNNNFTTISNPNSFGFLSQRSPVVSPQSNATNSLIVTNPSSSSQRYLSITGVNKIQPNADDCTDDVVG